MNIRFDIEALLLRLGYRPEQRGICTGIFSTAMQAFLCGEIEHYSKRIEWICTYRDLASKAKEVIRDLKANKSHTSEQDDIVDLLGFLDALMLSQIPKRYLRLFDKPVYQNEVMHLSTFIASKKLLEMRGLIEVKDNNPALQFTRKNLESHLTILHNILLRSTTNVVIKLQGMSGAVRHTIGICFDSDSKSWIMIDSSKFNSTPISDIKELVKSISCSLDTIDVPNFSLYTVEKNKLQTEEVFEEYKRTLVAAAAAASTPSQLDTDIKNKAPSLIIAAATGEADIVEEFAKNGEDLNQYKDEGRNIPMNAVMYAAYFGRANVIDVLSRYGANLNCNSRGCTAVSLAVKNAHPEALRSLINHGATIRGVTSGDVPLLSIAVQNNSLDCVDALVTANAEINASKRDGETPLFAASKYGYTDIVEYLILHGADLNKATREGSTPAFIAVTGGHVDAFEILARSGAELNRETLYHDTPLLTAIIRAELDIIKIMAAYGVDLLNILPNGKTPLEVARECDHDHVVEYLENHLRAQHAPERPKPWP